MEWMTPAMRKMYDNLLSFSFMIFLYQLCGIPTIVVPLVVQDEAFVARLRLIYAGMIMRTYLVQFCSVRLLFIIMMLVS